MNFNTNSIFELISVILSSFVSKCESKRFCESFQENNYKIDYTVEYTCRNFKKRALLMLNIPLKTCFNVCLSRGQSRGQLKLSMHTVEYHPYHPKDDVRNMLLVIGTDYWVITFPKKNVRHLLLKSNESRSHHELGRNYSATFLIHMVYENKTNIIGFIQVR